MARAGVEGPALAASRPLIGPVGTCRQRPAGDDGPHGGMAGCPSCRPAAVAARRGRSGSPASWRFAISSDAADDDAEVIAARRAAMAADPIRSILAAQHADGYWEKPGPAMRRSTAARSGSSSSLTSSGRMPTTSACDAAAPTSSSTRRCRVAGSARRVAPTGRPSASSIAHCLNGNLLRALIGFGWIDAPEVRAAIDWEARAITGEGVERWYATATSGPGFACAANEKLPCAWGAIKGLLGLAAVPVADRSPLVRRAIDIGAEFLLSRDPATADYPAGWGNAHPSRSWFRLGFPSGYVADVLQNLRGPRRAGICLARPAGSRVRLAPQQAGRPGTLAQRVRV